MHSAKQALRAVPFLASLVALSACTTTMEKNARTLVLNQRALASERPVQVTRADSSVKVVGISLVRAAGGSALVVRLLNTARRPLTDLPISVGIRTLAGRRIYFNRAANGHYYDAHVAALGANAIATWVYAAPRLPSRSGRLFAAVGFPRLPRSTTAARLPPLAARARGGVVRGVLRIIVSNHSSIPQYGLQVYAVALRDGRATGAGRGTIAELDGDGHASVALHLVGSAVGARLQSYALPTIFV